MVWWEKAQKYLYNPFILSRHSAALSCTTSLNHALCNLVIQNNSRPLKKCFISWNWIPQYGVKSSLSLILNLINSMSTSTQSLSDSTEHHGPTLWFFVSTGTCYMYNKQNNLCLKTCRLRRWTTGKRLYK